MKKGIVIIFLLNIITIANSNCFGESPESILVSVSSSRYKIYGHEISTKNIINGKKRIYIYNSPDKRSSVFGFVYEDIGEYWYYDIEADYTPKKLIEIPGRNIYVNWLSDNIVEVQTGGQGWRVSRLFDIKNSRKQKIYDPITFDAENEIYAAIVRSEDDYTVIIIGSLFSEIRKEFQLDLDEGEYGNIFSSIKNAFFNNNIFSISYVSKDKSLKTFKTEIKSILTN